MNEGVNCTHHNSTNEEVAETNSLSDQQSSPNATGKPVTDLAVAYRSGVTSQTVHSSQSRAGCAESTEGLGAGRWRICRAVALSRHFNSRFMSSPRASLTKSNGATCYTFVGGMSWK